MTIPLVALVGRPNAGKSTLFNRLIGEPLAIVDSIPGTTRDRLYADAEWNGIKFRLIDTGGIDPSTGGKDPLSVGSADYIQQIRTQAEIAISEADSVLFLTDAISGVTPADEEIASILRHNQILRDGKPFPPVLLVVNKSDNAKLSDEAIEFYELGLGEPYQVSALHGLGTGDLLDALVKSFGVLEEYPEVSTVKIAIVGKPNVGKSSLLNRLVGAERSIVSPIAGTTRDSVDTFLEVNNIPVTLIDTAGIRRRGHVTPGVEKYSVLRSMRAIERADVSLLLIDASNGITLQDEHIAGYILEAKKSAVVLVNKWDLIVKDTYTPIQFTEKIRQGLNFMDYVPILFISAKTGQRVDEVLPLALQVQEERLVRLTTSQINRILQAAQDTHPAPAHAGRALHMYYGTQVRSDPPTFLIYVNDPKLSHFSYIRFLENQIRKEYRFLGTPIQIVMRPRREE
jgi:GTPase